jgi:sugar phosphate isomerase/epimerase
MCVLIDAYNPVVYGYSTADMIRELHDIMCNQFHAKDGLNRKGGNALVGQGDGDFPATAQALKDIGFDGYVIGENDYTVETESRTAADIATLKQFFG